MTKLQRNRVPRVQLFLLIAGIVLVVGGLIGMVYSIAIFEGIVKQALELTPDSEPFRIWKGSDTVLELDLYLFNWTNHEDIRTSKPIFQEVGPYRVKEVKEKVNITWNTDNNTIGYKIRKKYFYDPDKSPRKMDEDMISTINAVPLTVAYQAQDFNYVTKRLFISGPMSLLSDLVVTKTAREILFDGYSDGILSALNRFPTLNIKEKFGLFYGKNFTIIDDHYTMHSKTDEHFGEQVTYRYSNRTDFYSGHCNDVKGSALEFYPLNIQQTKIVFYSAELCKYAEMEFDEIVTIKGVTGYKFVGDYIFDNGTLRPGNRCFCKNECLPSGVLDVSKCRLNSPTFLSFPHFYAADPYYRDSIEGMNPSKDKHQFYIIVEPKSSIIMEIEANMQLNMLLQPVSGFTFYSDVPKIFVPMFYFSQHIELKDDMAIKLRLIQNLPDILDYTFFIFMGIGILGICWSAYILVRNRKKLEEIEIEEEIPMNLKVAVVHQ